MSQIVLNEMASVPDAPAADKVALYAKDEKVYSIDDDGDVNLLTQDRFAFNVIIGDGVSSLTTGFAGQIEAPFDFTIDRVALYGNTSGSAVVDIWKDTYANYPPTDADSITSTTPPTITNGTQKSENTALTNWTKSVTAGDILIFNLDSILTIKQLTLVIRGKKV
jgi:hypothetical protein